MKRYIAMVFGLCFASLWLGCGMGADEAWSDEDGVVPAEGVVGETNDGLELRGQWPPEADDGPEVEEPTPDPITSPDAFVSPDQLAQQEIQRDGW